MPYRVEILPAAVADIEEAHLWLWRTSPDRASVWYDGLLDAISSLEEFPTRCARAAESDDLGLEIRQLLYGSRGSVYRILFRIVEPDAVRVLRVRHGSRDRLGPLDFESEE